MRHFLLGNGENVIPEIVQQHGTIPGVIKKHKSDGTIAYNPGSGHTKKLSDTDEGQIMRGVKKVPLINVPKF